MELLDFRDAVFDAMLDIISQDQNIVVLSNDMDALGLGKIRRQYPQHVINAGIQEQTLFNVASGLALTGKTVFVYGIIPHLTARCYDQLKLSVCAMNLPVITVGVGSGVSYGTDGLTHFGESDLALLRPLPNMKLYSPADAVTAKHCLLEAYHQQHPSFLRLDKEQHHPLYQDQDNFDFGFHLHGKKSSVVLVATGILVHRALLWAELLSARGIAPRIIDLFRIKPAAKDDLAKELAAAKVVCVIEEHVSTGGVASLIEEILVENRLSPRLLKYNLGDQVFFGSASRTALHRELGFGDQLIEKIIESADGLA